MVRVDVTPAVLTWAQRRSGVGLEELKRRFPAFDAWRTGTAQPTLRQLEGFAQATHTPAGFLFLPEPPVEVLPLPDFRTVGNVAVEQPTANLLDTVYQCQERQEWYREWALANQEGQTTFVSSLRLTSPIIDAARTLRRDLHFGVNDRGGTWTEALTRLRENADDIGVLVMVSGVVGSNTHRKLDAHEFRGFSLVDRVAPLVFVNGADTKAAQIFTLAHELAHIWLGESALDDPDLTRSSSNPAEAWCNNVAAEMLLPLEDLRQRVRPGMPSTADLEALAKAFKVSTLVVLRRIFDAGHITWNEYRAAYVDELERVMDLIGSTGEGGNFYNTQPVRVSKRFARAVVASTLEGHTRYSDAFQMLGFRKQSTFDQLARRLLV